MGAMWESILEEAAAAAKQEPALASVLHTNILNHGRLEDSLSFVLAEKLGGPAVSALTLRSEFDAVFRADPTIGEAVRADLRAVVSRDPATRGYSQPLLSFKGFHALQTYRIAHYYWEHGREPIALFLQSRVSEVFGVDIHPAARIGRGIMFDHATSIVIGETAVIDDDVSLLHEVTLGGTGKETGDRHPKIRRGVMIGAGSKILGNVVVGEGAKVGAGSVVLEDVPPHSTVVGVPARAAGKPAERVPAYAMDQRIVVVTTRKNAPRMPAAAQDVPGAAPPADEPC
ncbi:MAG TPA: serine O-acetyltransferase [Actinomycetaceae bacterium]|nr:serine O-acetyltransferase [Actinomycetaceae bacterium]